MVERQGQGNINVRFKRRNHNHNPNYNLMSFDTIEINLVISWCGHENITAITPSHLKINCNSIESKFLLKFTIQI